MKIKTRESKVYVGNEIVGSVVEKTHKVPTSIPKQSSLGDLVLEYVDGYSDVVIDGVHEVVDFWGQFGPRGRYTVGGNFCLIRQSYFKKTVKLGCGVGDYCLYCGTFNGAEGEYRQGWDCYSCGGN